jgi:integrase
MRQFSVFKRSATGLYYVQFRDPETGLRLGRRSLATADRDQALLRVAEWMRDGIPAPKKGRRSLERTFSLEVILHALHDAPLTASDASRIVADLRARGLLDKKGNASPEASEPLGTWLRAFWKYDGTYIQERLAHGQRATHRHCQDMEGRAREIEALLPLGLALGEVRRSHLVNLGLALKARGLAPATVNKTMSAATTALRWAAVNEIIVNDPTRGLRGFSGAHRVRGILEPAEVKALFSSTWTDERARVACLVAATTGARLGEVLAIQRQDIGEDRLFIRHSYSIRDKLKTPKNGEARVVPLLPGVRSALLTLEAKSPHPAEPERFVFAGFYPDRPLDGNRILLGMRKALVAMNGGTWGDDKKPKEKAVREKILAEYSVRGIDFHSWRHWYATNMADRLDARTVQKATGHKTEAMLEHYADHELEGDLSRLGVAAGEAFGEFIAL